MHNTGKVNETIIDMFGQTLSKTTGSSSTPEHFKDSARNAVYLQIPRKDSTNSSIQSSGESRKARSLILSGSLVSSIFSSRKRSSRSSSSIYSNTSTIPENSEPYSVTVEQLVSDIALHENYNRKVLQERIGRYTKLEDEHWKISLGSLLEYHSVHNILVDWNLNVTRCKLFLMQLPSKSSSPDLTYPQESFPQLVGDLSRVSHITLLKPDITDREFMQALFLSNIYEEHNLEMNFKKVVAEVSVEQSRLLDINSRGSNSSTSNGEHCSLRFQFKEIALRNYLVNLAAAATTSYEYNRRYGEAKKSLTLVGKKLSSFEKKQIWDQCHQEVYKRVGL